MGCSIDVLTLTGMVEMKVPPATQPGAQLVMKGKGIKNVNSITKLVKCRVCMRLQCADIVAYVGVINTFISK